jgi:ketosteroid isomerase-like protein
MATADLELAERFREALEAAVRTGDREPVYALLAPDVEWVTPLRTLLGVDDMRANWSWGSSPESFDYEFEEGDWADLGDGRLACEVRQVYRLKESGDFAYERKRRVVLTIRDGMISRYELIVAG